MKLLAELINQPGPIETLDEALVTGSERDRNMKIAKFRSTWKLVERDVDHLNIVFSETSQLSKLVEELGGDMAEFKALVKMTEKLYDAVDEMHMSVGIAIGDDWGQK